MTDVLIRRGDEDTDTQREGHRGKRAIHRPRRGLGRNQPCGHLDLRLPAPTSLLLKPPVGGAVWRQPELTDTGLTADDAGRVVPLGCAHQGALEVRTRGWRREPEWGTRFHRERLSTDESDGRQRSLRTRLRRHHFLHET